MTGAAPALTAAPPKRQRHWLWPTVVIAALIAGFLTAALSLEGPLATPRYIPIATEAGIQTMPAWSPTGDWIAYSGEVNGSFWTLNQDCTAGSSTFSR